MKHLKKKVSLRATNQKCPPSQSPRAREGLFGSVVSVGVNLVFAYFVCLCVRVHVRKEKNEENKGGLNLRNRGRGYDVGGRETDVETTRNKMRQNKTNLRTTAQSCSLILASEMCVGYVCRK